MRRSAAAALGLLAFSAAHAQVINPAVTQANIDQTICNPDWTAATRPHWTYTSRLKREQMHAAGLPGELSDYQEDHIIPLGLGGHPADPRNLLPQPWPEAERKDEDEFRLHQLVCRHRMSLDEAQRAMAAWRP
ncbi:MAG: hypothetical protein JOZ17_27050 [Acetobacteraceae bacterium]|nr:hypothetical protein [Acetobacteraceae bacterium]